MTEIHDLPSTLSRIDCWLAVHRRSHAIVCAYHSTSRASGWALPAEYDVIFHGNN